MLQNKVALITGAAAGIGAGISKLFVANGASVVLMDVAPTFTAADVLGSGSTAQNLDSRVLCLGGMDVSKEANWASAVREAQARFGGRIDVLVNNAGIIHVAPIEETSADVFRRVLDVNVVGAFLGMKAVTPIMKQQQQTGGSIVNVASMAAMRGVGGHIAYNASKGAVRMATKSLALELATHKVRVNCLCPGTIRTPMGERLASQFNKTPEAMGQVCPMQRLGTPDEIAQAALFLASDMSSYITGIDLCADGGSTVGFTGTAPI